MTFHACRLDGTIIGEFSEGEFREKVFSNELMPEDYYWHEGMSDWAPVSNYRASTKTTKIEVSKPPPLPAIPQAPLPKPPKQSSPPAVTGGLCAIAAAFAPLLHPVCFFLISLPFLVAAFVLAIVSIVRGKVGSGIALLAGTMIAFLMSIASMTIDRDKLFHHPAQMRQGR
jgi:hypothetical protein